MNVIVLVAIALISVIASAFGSAVTTKPVSNESQYVFDGSNSGYVIAAGGYSNNNWFTNVYALDLNSGQWTGLTPLPQGLSGFNLVLRDSTIYAVAGQRIQEPQYLNTVQILSIQENIWKSCSNLIYSSGHVLSVSINASIYAVGGTPTSNILQFMGCNGEWRRLASSIYNHNSNDGAIAVLNNKIYVFGCHHQDEVYDTSTNTWTGIKMTNLDRCKAGIVALNGYIYVIGGTNAKNERYDPATGEIIYFQNCLFNSVYAAAVVTDGEMIYVIGGNANKVQMYRPDMDMWQSLTPYPMDVGYLGAVYVKELPTN